MTIVSPGFAAAIAFRREPPPLSLPLVTLIVAAAFARGAKIKPATARTTIMASHVASGDRRGQRLSAMSSP